MLGRDRPRKLLPSSSARKDCFACLLSVALRLWFLAAVTPAVMAAEALFDVRGQSVRSNLNAAAMTADDLFCKH